MIKIKEIIEKFEAIAGLHPNINYFGFGKIYDIPTNIKYPYLWVAGDERHRIEYSEDNGYRAVEYNFNIRIGDKINNQLNYPDGNRLDIINNTFIYMMDIINTISNDSLNIFNDIELIDTIYVEPFYNEDQHNVDGHSAILTLRVKNDKSCLTPLN